MLRETKDGVYKFFFDYQKNLVLPKVPNQAYYSRQMYQYNFTIYKEASRDTQNREKANIFTWGSMNATRGKIRYLP